MKATDGFLGHKGEEGAALVVAVAALLIMSLVALTAVVLSTSERNFGAGDLIATTSFYSADAGVQVSYNKLKRFINEGFSNLPFDTANDTNALSDIKLRAIVDSNNAIGVLSYAFYDVAGRQFRINTNSTNAAPLDTFAYELYNIANEVDKGLIPASGSSPSLTMNFRNPSVTTGNFAGTNINVIGPYTHQSQVTINRNGLPIRTTAANGAEVFTFPYRYTVQTQSIRYIDPNQPARGVRALKTISLAGDFTLTIQRRAFSAFALFTNKHRNSANATVYFTSRTNFDGPVHTNGRFFFANNPSGTFTDEVSQWGDEDGNGVRETDFFKLGFYNNGRPIKVDGDRNGNIDVPKFQQGINRRGDKIDMPANTFDQSSKSLGTRDPSTITATGVYVNNTYGGGIYVKGNVKNLRLQLDANGNQVYVFNRGASQSNPTTTTITLDRANNQTIVVDGNSPAEVTPGLPNGLIYVDGAIGRYAMGNDDKAGGVGGTIQRDNLLTIAASGDIFINDNIQYQDPNVNSSNPSQNVLGILADTGNVTIRNNNNTPYNYTIDASLMTLKGEVSVENYSSGAPKGTVNLLGGIIEYTYGAFGTFSGNSQVSGYSRNFVYDRRFRDGTFSPPFFPLAPNYVSNSTLTSTARPQWAEK